MSEATFPYPDGMPCWVDLMTPDVAAVLPFYRSVFAWEGEPGPAEMGYYTLCTLGGKMVAGIGQIPPDTGDSGDPGSLPTVWNTYLATGDLDATIGRVTAAGGQVGMGPVDIPGAGRMAMITDPAGAVSGLWEPREHRGAELVNEPGTLVWNELYTRDGAAARDFWTAVFGYAYESMGGPDFDYHVVRVGDRECAGIAVMDENFPAEVPPHWLTYFSVADTDDTAARVTAAGGSVVRPPSDSPYGRLALVRDPAGAPFSIIAGGESNTPGA